MLTVLLISQCILVVVLIVFAVALLGMARQIGVLHERLQPLDPADQESGLEVGRAMPRMALEGVDGPSVAVGEALLPGHRQLLLFVAPDCPVCKRVIPSALQISESGAADLVFVGDGSRPELTELGKTVIRGRAPLTVAAELGLVLQVSRLPFAAVVDEHGVLAARGLVSNSAHLEALLREAA
ncbi:thioredoxin domain-containing protein [Acetobacter oeni]|uniref:Thioredoxin domain-containing protein n=1 Tax=Acetobacter oeni TaxID=304077 RepID=A0A511XM59_9PROT|nr:alkyl hydroperoxide reductase [Acetobacter oeni]MBB3884043.1 methylamine dehydrogenase accessory protein MauD [Acetobacter oeni]NHO20012.1 alkyl hydroperoxide reductase [Acetobacter oeni]GBR08469.1 hypothetical protein AA21952_2627 [Acetobacter oeni LMG 21952]GEN64030.1 hypothetical protein AOE01nite_22540 [Acetobacter oeni]